MTAVGEAYRCGYRDGVVAARKAQRVSTNALLGEFHRLELEVAQVRAELALALADPERPMHWSMH